jgi:hypothetical protein
LGEHFFNGISHSIFFSPIFSAPGVVEPNPVGRMSARIRGSDVESGRRLASIYSNIELLYNHRRLAEACQIRFDTDRPAMAAATGDGGMPGAPEASICGVSKGLLCST